MKTNIKSLLLAATLSVAAFTATATPQYTGNTFGTGNGVNSATGYYLWNDASSPSNWSLRWSDQSAAGSPIVEWVGSIIFGQSNLGTVSEFSFETGPYTDSSSTAYDSGFFGGGDGVEFTAFTSSTGVDGIDFTLLGDTELMGFSLGSSLFSSLPENLLDASAAQSTSIFIGSGLSGTKVLVTETGGFRRQSFEILVPAPGALALMGLGLLGLGLARRKQTKK
jgi:hypothetical protein